MQRDDVVALLYGSQRLLLWASRIESLFRHSIRLMTTRRPSLSEEPRYSKVGGLPGLATDVEWPRHKDRPMTFVAQLHLDALSAYDSQQRLPARGFLYFFVDDFISEDYESHVWGAHPRDRGAWKVMFRDDRVLDLLPRAAPEGLAHEPFSPLMVDFETEVTLPDLATPELEEVGIDRDLYFEFWEKVHGAKEFEVRHRLFGWPDQVQDDMRQECELAFNGIDPDDLVARKNPDVMAPLRGAEDWVLLLQIASDPDRTGMMWGDMGKIYYWIRRSDLEAWTFNSVWLKLQCS